MFKVFLTIVLRISALVRRFTVNCSALGKTIASCVFAYSNCQQIFKKLSFELLGVLRDKNLEFSMQTADNRR